MGLWLADTEGAKFWLSVLTELRNRGVEDILIACVDGLKGFPEAIASEHTHKGSSLAFATFAVFYTRIRGHPLDFSRQPHVRISPQVNGLVYS